MGDRSEYSENVPSDLEFLGGQFESRTRGWLETVDDNDGPGLRLVKEVVLKMVESSAACISVEPFEECTRVRGKFKGKWRELMRFPAARHREFVIAVVDLWCGTPEPDVGWRHPFDGVLLLSETADRWYDLWVSAVPGVHGFILLFSFYLREQTYDLDLDKLGFDPVGLEALKRAVDAPAGMVLLSGPTHSGKSVVCCSALMRRLRRGDSATTIERPRKFRLPGARQILLKHHADYCLEYGNALADDPRVLMVQELRYVPDFSGALAAAKGRLVVAATHMHDAVTCLRCLNRWGRPDLDPEADPAVFGPYKEGLAENLGLVCSGRLLNLLCPSCRTAVEMPVSLLERNGLPVGRKGSLLTFEKGSGCPDCRGTGISRRTGIYEVLPLSPAMKRLLGRFVLDCALIRQAREDGLVSLREAALKLVLRGEVSFQEAISATPAPYFWPA